MSLHGKRAIVTGAARGLGAEIARGFVAAGMRVTCMDVRAEQGAALAAEIGCAFVACDITNKAAVDEAFERACVDMAGLDVLAAVAGLDKPGFAPENIPLDAWHTVLAVNATGTFLTNQAAFRRMTHGSGRIINFASFAGIRGYAERAAYAAAKGAVLAWTRSAAQAWGPAGITVNAIAPQMHTDVAERSLASLDPQRREQIEASWVRKVPIGGRLGHPATELVPLALFLAGDGAGFITGQTFAVDGGMTMLGS